MEMQEIILFNLLKLTDTFMHIGHAVIHKITFPSVHNKLRLLFSGFSCESLRIETIIFPGSRADEKP